MRGETPVTANYRGFFHLPDLTLAGWTQQWYAMDSV